MGVQSQSAYDTARDILITMGIYFQAQDDYLDCFASEEVLGKRGTDIWDKKCGWLFVHAYHHLVDDEQKFILQENYGKGPDEEKEKVVKDLYRELGLEQMYNTYEADTKVALEDQISKVTELPQEIFHIFLKKIFKRQK
eukprot:scaffold433_cov257-Pinguiococcus_pyrenoidosus.AAC.8